VRVGELGEGSPGSREAEGEGGEGFYIARNGRRPDLLVIWGGRMTGTSIHCGASKPSELGVRG